MCQHPTKWIVNIFIYHELTILVTKCKHCKPKGKCYIENYLIICVTVCAYVKPTKSFLHKLVTSCVIIVWEKLNIIKYVSWCRDNEKKSAFSSYSKPVEKSTVVFFQKSLEISSHQSPKILTCGWNWWHWNTTSTMT